MSTAAQSPTNLAPREARSSHAARWPTALALVLAAVAAGPPSAATIQPATLATPAPAPTAIRVTLLGTGTPTPDPTRAGPGILVQTHGLSLVFDAGRFVTVRLVQAGLRLDSIDGVFLTHLHFDHTTDLPDLLLTSRMPVVYGMRSRPLALFGPLGTTGLARGIESAYAGDIKLRRRSQLIEPRAATFDAHEFYRSGVVFARAGVTVRAFEVDHGDGAHESYGYRIDAGGHSVVISGDTKFDERVIAASQSVDLLIHEVADIPLDYQRRFPAMVGVVHVHTSPQEAGTVFARAKPRLALYTHVAMIGGSTPADVIAHTRETYSGPLEVGEDLMQVDVGERIVVTRAVPKNDSQEQE